MKNLALFLLGGLLSFDVSARAAEDGYRFGEKEYEKLEFHVTIVLFRDAQEMVKLGRKHGFSRRELAAYSKDGVAAFSILREEECIIFMKDADWEYEPEYYGHELAHCIWGRWHN